MPEDEVLDKDPADVVVETPEEETPVEVLAPEVETLPTDTEVVKTPDEEPSAADLKARLDALEAENADLKAKVPAEAPDAEPRQRVSMTQVFVSQTVPKAKALYAAEKDPAKQFEIMAETANQLLGAVMTDTITPSIQKLAAVNVELINELTIRDLRDDPEFKSVEAQVREQLRKTDWKTRASETAVQDIFHRIRGAKKNGMPTSPAKKESTPTARAVLKDLAAGGGASPKPAGVRLTQEQEGDYQAILKDGIDLTRAEYYAKWKSRADQAKAAGRKIPSTYRG